MITPVSVGGSSEASNFSSIPPWTLPAVMAALTAALFCDVLLFPGRIPSEANSDLRCQYLCWWQFGFSQIRHGHFPLWNPYCFGGTPFFGDPQSAMLYPPNWLHLLLPTALAACWLTAIHFFLAGYFAGLFCRSLGSSVVGAILGGIVYACSGPIVANLRPGHLPLLFSAAWSPLLLTSLEKVIAGKRIGKWMLIGIGSVAMLALDGYPQFAYYSALACGLYFVIRTPVWRGRWRDGLFVVAILTGGCAIAAAQIVASAQFSGESIRAGGLPYAAAAQYSLPPENLLTLIVPGVFGDAAHFPYYGRWYWWETCLFIGPGALALAVAGGVASRTGRIMLCLAGVTIILALGANTPLFGVLYSWLAGFNRFRATARFDLLAVLFLAAGAAIGWDRCVERRRLLPALAAGGMGLALVVAAIWAANAQSVHPGDFDRIISRLADTHEAMEGAAQNDTSFADSASRFAERQFALAAAGLGVVALLLARRKRPSSAAALAIFIVGQAVCFAIGQRTSSDASMAMPAAWAQAFAAVPGGQRVFVDGTYANAGAINGFLNVGGFNPLLLKRTAGFLAALQGNDPETIGIYDPIRRILPQYRILRCEPILRGKSDGPVDPVAVPLPRLSLVGRYEQAADANQALKHVMDPGFDPVQTVVLERAPSPLPAVTARPGRAEAIAETTDSLEIEADLPVPQILLVTDAYSAGWRVEPLETGPQTNYQVVPGDYCLQAIPLSAGHHHFRLEYHPAGLLAGMWISIGALEIYSAVCVHLAWNWRRKTRRGAAPGEAH